LNQDGPVGAVGQQFQAERFDALTVHPAGLAVYHLGNNGTARELLKARPATSS